MGFIFGVVVGIIVGLAIIVGFVRGENSRAAQRSQLATTVAAFARMTVEDSRKILPPQFYPSWVVFSSSQKLSLLLLSTSSSIFSLRCFDDSHFFCYCFQLTWLNSHLTKIWPYVNEVVPSALCFRFGFRCGSSFFEEFVNSASVLLGCF